MTNIQSLIAVGLPMLVLATGMWMNSSAVNHLRADMNSRFTLMENRFNSLAESMDRLIGICKDLDKRISIIEDRMHPR
jgi:hypothetical protein